MGGLEVGSVCIKVRGRSAGSAVVVVEKGKDFVVVDGVDVKRKRCNPRHLLPTGKAIKIAKGAPHEEVAKLMGAKGGH